MNVKSLNQILKCGVCGNMFEVVHVGGGEPACCGKEVVHMRENSEDASTEKHVPAVEKTSDGYKIKVGSVPHPMETAHYIEWIELIADGVSYKKFLQPGDAPEAEFCVSAESVIARAYCNLHGLWKNN